MTRIILAGTTNFGKEHAFNVTSLDLFHFDLTKKDSFFRQPAIAEYASRIVKGGGTIEDLLIILSDLNSPSRFVLTPKEAISIPGACHSKRIRFGSALSPKMALEGCILATELLPHYCLARSPWEKNLVFMHCPNADLLPSTTRQAGLFENCYPLMLEQNLSEIEDGQKTVGFFDIQGFYPSIGVSEVESALKRVCDDSCLISRILEWLIRCPECVLPQGYVISDLLAELYILPAQVAAYKRGIFLRAICDDHWLFGPNRLTVGKALADCREIFFDNCPNLTFSTEKIFVSDSSLDAWLCVTFGAGPFNNSERYFRKPLNKRTLLCDYYGLDHENNADSVPAGELDFDKVVIETLSRELEPPARLLRVALKKCDIDILDSQVDSLAQICPIFVDAVMPRLNQPSKKMFLAGLSKLSELWQMEGHQAKSIVSFSRDKEVPAMRQEAAEICYDLATTISGSISANEFAARASSVVVAQKNLVRLASDECSSLKISRIRTTRVLDRSLRKAVLKATVVDRPELAPFVDAELRFSTA